MRKTMFYIILLVLSLIFAGCEVDEGEVSYTIEAQWSSHDQADTLTTESSTNIATVSTQNQDLSSFPIAEYVQNPSAKEIKPTSIIIKFRGNATTITGLSLRNLPESILGFGEQDVSLPEDTPFTRYLVNSDYEGDLEQILADLNGDSTIEYAEIDVPRYAHTTPNDPYFYQQWNFTNLDMTTTWDITQGDADVIVAVIDTGVRQSLSDLANTNFTTGYDFVNNDSNPDDDYGHGSHVTGTIAQSTDNALGVAGIAPGVTVMPIKVLDSEGGGSVSNVALGIRYAVDHGADIINLSLGGSASTTEEVACQYALDNGVAIFASAGNDTSSTLSYPAAYDGVVSVGAVNDLNNLAWYSNYGEGLDVVAPGGDSTRTLTASSGETYPAMILQQTKYQNEEDFWFLEGTSMAAPHVSALAALLLSQNHNLSVDEITGIIQDSATDLGSTGYDTTYGYGLINPVAALGLANYGIDDTIGSTVLVGSEPVVERWQMKNATGTITATVTYTAKSSLDITFNLSLEDEAGNVVATTNEAVETISSGELTGVMDLSYEVTAATEGSYVLEISVERN